MTKKIALVVLVVALALALVVLPGCTKDKTSDGSATLPEGFPADVPVYSGTIVDAAETPADGGSGYNVEVAAPDPVKDVVTWYETKLADEGWMVATASTPNGGGNVISGDKDGQAVTITVLNGDEGTDLTIEYAPAK